MSSKENYLQQVLTNEHVITMVGTTLREELTNQEIDEKELPSAECEPKMTRSRAKEVMENEKNALHPWPLYPLKKKKAPGILELTFSEDDEDEEYTPEKDQCKLLASSASIAARWKPSLRFASFQGEEEADEQMASRTRSKFSLTDKSLTELEADFIDPDITVDLDNTECDDQECECDDKECECDDKEWKEFLFSIHKSDKKSPENQHDQEEGDPEYNYLEDAEKEVCDEEDFRSDRDVQVSVKELNDLMAEMIAVYEDDTDEDADMVPASSTKPIIQLQGKMLHDKANEENTPEDGIDEMT